MKAKVGASEGGEKGRIWSGENRDGDCSVSDVCSTFNTQSRNTIESRGVVKFQTDFPGWRKGMRDEWGREKCWSEKERG